MFNVQGSMFRVQCSGFRVQGSGFRVQGSKKQVCLRAVKADFCAARILLL